jgi:membrane protease YdiL (CAAX protease family)
MSATRTSFWRDSRNLYVLYMVAGVAAIPAGLIYAILGAEGLDQWWSTVPLLALGVVSSLLAWSFFEKRWFPRQLSRSISIMAYEVSPMGIRPAPVPAAAFTIVVFLTFGSSAKMSVRTLTENRPAVETGSTSLHHSF